MGTSLSSSSTLIAPSGAWGRINIPFFYTESCLSQLSVPLPKTNPSHLVQFQPSFCRWFWVSPFPFFPAGVQLKVSSLATFIRRFLIWRSILTQPVSWYRLLLEILLGQKMLQIGHYNENQNCSHQEIMLSLSKSRNNVIIK